MNNSQKFLQKSLINMPLKDTHANQSSFMIKSLSKAIMKRSQLRNKFLKHKTEESVKVFDIQKN